MTDVSNVPPRGSARGFLRELFTERDNQTADLKRVLWAAGFCWALAMATWDVVWRGHPFDLQAAAWGVGGLLAAGAGGLAMNRRNENGAP